MERLVVGMLSAVLGLCFISWTAAQGQINIQGCTEAFVRLTCPSDDVISVHDVRISEVDPGHRCRQQLHPTKVSVPVELQEFCRPGNDTEEGHMCMYVEDICEDKNDCVFYVSPHYFNHEFRAYVNSEVVVSFECKPGKKRKGEIGFAAFVATIGIVSLLVVSGLLVWRILTTDQNTYAEYPLPAGSSQTSVRGTSGAGYGGNREGAASASVSDDRISVQLQAGSTHY